MNAAFTLMPLSLLAHCTISLNMHFPEADELA